MVGEQHGLGLNLGLPHYKIKFNLGGLQHGLGLNLGLQHGLGSLLWLQKSIYSRKETNAPKRSREGGRAGKGGGKINYFSFIENLKKKKRKKEEKRIDINNGKGGRF